MEDLVIEKVPINTLFKDPANLRRHDKKNLEAIKGSLQRFGQRKPIVVDKKNIIIAGNGTYEAASSLGWDHIYIVRTDLEGMELTAFAIADNRTAELANWDDESLNKTLKDLEGLKFDLSTIGFGDFLTLDSKTKSIFPGDKDAIPEEVEKNVYGVKVGDIWKLGSNRLICGDSSSPDIFKRLCKGDKAELLWTDPPYNIDYGGSVSKKRDKIKNDIFQDQKQYVEFLKTVLDNTAQVLKSGAVFYISHADNYGTFVRNAVNDCSSKFYLSQVLIWVKNRANFNRTDYHWGHEPILYGWLEGSTHRWYSDRCQTTVLNFSRPSKSIDHPTMKPCDLIQYMIKNSSKDGDLVIDPFGGSGSTLIACQDLDRRCYMVELDENYCSIIIKRWEDFTGGKAIRLEG